MPMNDSQKTVSAWAPLGHALFRTLWITSVISNIGAWMEDVGVAWLMTSQTPSPLWVALLSTAESLPIFILALPAGALADVVDRRHLLLFTQVWLCLASTILGVLTLLGFATPVVLLVIAFTVGIATALNVPAWQAITQDLVPREQLSAAAGLGAVGFNIARAVGPAVGGLLVAATGPGAVFLLNAACFVAVIFALYSWKRDTPTGIAPAERLVTAMRAGVRYTLHAPAFRSVLIRTIAFIFCGSALWALLPTIARRELELTSFGYGLLLGSLGSGAITGALVLPWVRNAVASDRIALVATLVWASVLVVFAFVRIVPALHAVLFIGGMAWIALITSFNVAAQTAVPAWVRGRCLAVYMLAFQGGIAAGSATWGVLADYTTIEWALIAAAIGLMVGPLAALHYRLPEGDGPDLTPSMHWSNPVVAYEPNHEHGPVLITVEYRVDSSRTSEFVAAMKELETTRRRDGAFRWGLYRDVAAPDRWVETFLVETWGEHVRQHGRITADDQTIEERVRALLQTNTSPVISHLIWGMLPAEELATFTSTVE
jgi:MFS family permease/quinol monooxygenase YgiN